MGEGLPGTAAQPSVCPEKDAHLVPAGCHISGGHRFGRLLEWIKGCDAAPLKISDVAGHDDKFVHLRRRGQSGIVGILVRLTEHLPPTACDSLIYREDTTFIGGEVASTALAIIFATASSVFRFFSMPFDISRTEITLIARSVSSIVSSPSRHILVWLAATYLLQDKYRGDISSSVVQRAKIGCAHGGFCRLLRIWPARLRMGLGIDSRRDDLLFL